MYVTQNVTKTPKSNEQVSGYQMIASACRQANHKHDLAQFVKAASSAQLSSGTGNELSSGLNHQAASNGHHQDDDSLAGGGGGSSGDNHSKSVASQIRYHHFQAPSLQNASSELCQFDPTNMVSVVNLCVSGEGRKWDGMREQEVVYSCLLVG